ncbi:MAG: Ni/Fe hydrogenase subunit alpha [Anaerolineaceae bacterium]|nr:Ni/Fe hydrogenase subunit alpha [Anaerolineaceae bacterium]
MSKTITIDPVTRIEGHGKITLQLNDAGEVADAHFHVTQLRGFEKFSEGRPFREMPGLMARICGICPVSHLVASAKACDEILAVRIPPTAVNLRKILNLAQMVQSHALSVFYLSAPDLILGMDADPNQRNIFGMMAADPQLARDGVRLRQFGQQVIERLSGKRIHPNWVVAGGVDEPLSETARDLILADIPEVKRIARQTLDWFIPLLDQFREEIRVFANFPTMYMGMINPDGSLEHYDGILRIIDADGKHVTDVDPTRYMDIIGEAVEDHSYLKSPFYKPLGYPAGIYRVGPLARLNMATHAGTPLADEALKAYQTLDWKERQSSFYFHYARLIEILYGIERIEELLHTPNILDKRVQALANINSEEGIGISEAPRGTLLHHYRADEHGLITWANLIIATGHNNLAMDRGVLQTARHFVRGNTIQEGMLNRVEAVIRTFDPCLSCSTHAVGQMPLHIELLAPDGSQLDTVQRG